MNKEIKRMLQLAGVINEGIGMSNEEAAKKLMAYAKEHYTDGWAWVVEGHNIASLIKVVEEFGGFEGAFQEMAEVTEYKKECQSNADCGGW